ncbi:MAG: rRNA maturation RNase YbeY [Verrucomicrobiales bacterium]|nr:rRNA maturation RNase YbeY [Verrucomicrobiales bacterium]
MSPELEFYSHLDEVTGGDVKLLAKWSQLALPDCLASPGPGSCDLPDLDVVEISIVTDETIAEVHGQFLDDPTPTDVITFHHGELLVSYDTAKSVAASLDHSPLEELFLYVVHGLLHLNGHLDKEKVDREEMHRLQNGIWLRICESSR